MVYLGSKGQNLLLIIFLVFQFLHKLKECLEYHKEMEKKQSMALENKAIILDQHQQIAKSLEKTLIDMDEAFQEILKKTESQKLLLNHIFHNLNKGVSNV